MSKVHGRGPRTPEMNMTPLIDVTFQLIIFFMLVNNIIAEQTVQMIVPALEDPKTREIGEMTNLVINIAPQDYRSGERDTNPLNWDGVPIEVRVGMARFGLDNMRGVTEEIQRNVSLAPVGPDGQSTLEVLLRADAAIRYEEVQPIMAAITAANVGTIHMVAYMPGEGPKPPSP